MDVSKFFRFDQWANGVLLDVVPETCAPAVRFLAHIVGAEHVWLARLNGEAQPCPVWPEWNLAETRRWYERLPAMLETWVSHDDQTIAYTNQKGDQFENTTTDILHHVAFHGVHHRAQILLELRRVGIEPPALDYIFAIRKNLIA